MWRSTVFHENRMPQTIPWVLCYLVHKLVYPRRHPFSMYFARYSAPFLLNDHHVSSAKCRNAPVDGPRRVSSKLGSTTRLVILLFWPPSDKYLSKAFDREGTLVSPDDLSPLLWLPTLSLKTIEVRRHLQKCGSGIRKNVEFYNYYTLIKNI